VSQCPVSGDANVRRSIGERRITRIGSSEGKRTRMNASKAESTQALLSYVQQKLIY